MRLPSFRLAGVLALIGVVLLSASTATQIRPRDQAIEIVNGREVAAGEVIVRFASRPSRAQSSLVVADAGADAAEPIGRAGLMLVRSRSLGTAALISRLTARGDVIYAEPNYVVRTFAEPNDPMWPQLWGLRNIGQSVNGLPGTPGADIYGVRSVGPDDRCPIHCRRDPRQRHRLRPPRSRSRICGPRRRRSQSRLAAARSPALQEPTASTPSR